MYIDDKKTLKNCVNILASVKAILKQNKLIKIMYNAIDNDTNLKIDLPVYDVDTNITKLCIIKQDYRLANIIVYTDNNIFKIYIDYDNYIDYGIKSIYLTLPKTNSINYIDYKDKFIFNIDKNTFSIDYVAELAQYYYLQIYLTKK